VACCFLRHNWLTAPPQEVAAPSEKQRLRLSKQKSADVPLCLNLREVTALMAASSTMTSLTRRFPSPILDQALRQVLILADVAPDHSARAAQRLTAPGEAVFVILDARVVAQ
jgi:hypothetical protein